MKIITIQSEELKFLFWLIFLGSVFAFLIFLTITFPLVMFTTFGLLITTGLIFVHTERKKNKNKAVPYDDLKIFEKRKVEPKNKRYYSNSKSKLEFDGYRYMAPKLPEFKLSAIRTIKH